MVNIWIALLEATAGAGPAGYSSAARVKLLLDA